MSPVKETKARLFIGSSVEGLPEARALRDHFEFNEDVDADLWTDVNFELSKATLDTLVNDFLEKYQYGVFVMTPDDLVEKRGEKRPAPRDNVLFELGLFFGRAGRDRTFIVKPRDKEIDLPTDLGGITPATYKTSSNPERLKSDLAHAARQIQLKIRMLEDHRRQSARQEVFHQMKDLRKAIHKAGDDQQRIQLVLDAFGSIIRHRALAMNQSVGHVLEDVILTAKDLRDKLDAPQLAEAQSEMIKEVWVFAPEPLETRLGGDHKDVRRKVFQNILAGVCYTYFVESESGVRRIRDLVQLMIQEHTRSGGRSKQGRTAGNAKAIERKLLDHTTVVVLPPEYYLTYFTVHKDHNEGRIEVIQSVLRTDRDDFLVTLEDKPAERVFSLIQELYNKTVEKREKELRIRRLLPGQQPNKSV